MFRSRNALHTLTAIVFAASLMSARPAHSQLSVTYVTGSYSQLSIGDTIGSLFDKLFLTPRTATVSLTCGVPVTLPVNDLAFVAGVNTTFAHNSLLYTASRAMTVNGVPGTISQNFYASISSQDTLFLLTGATTSFAIPGQGTVDVTPLGQTVGPSGGGTTNSTVMATFLFTDTVAPTISGVSTTPNSLWPPNHKLVDVTVNYSATDNQGIASCTLSATSNEPDDGLGDGDTANDIQVVDAHHILLRAERSGTGSGRIYTITITCTDLCGNTTTATTTVTVPHDKK